MVSVSKKIVSTFALVVLLAACGREYDSLKGTSTDPSIPAVGAWDTNSSDVVRNSTGSAKQRFKITKDSFTSIVRCAFDNGTEVDVSVTAKAKIDPTTIEILENKSNSNTANGKRCYVSLQKGRANYRVNGNKMTLQMGYSSLVLERL